MGWPYVPHAYCARYYAVVPWYVALMIILVILNTDMPFEIFPGNVGDDSALATALIRLSRGEKQTD